MKKKNLGKVSLWRMGTRTKKINKEDEEVEE
jgi:hypothetical protein